MLGNRVRSTDCAVAELAELIVVLLIAGTLLVSAWILALPLLALIGCLPLAIGGSLLYRAIFAKTQAELERVDF